MVLYWSNPRGSEVTTDVVAGVPYHSEDFSRLKMPKLQMIKLWGCNTSGRIRQEHSDELYGDENIAHRLALMFPGASVEGNRGEFHGGNEFGWGRIYTKGKGVIDSFPTPFQILLPPGI